MAADTKIVRKQGGSVLEVKSGGTILVDAGGNLQLTDTATGTVYNITIENGVLAPVEV